MKVLVIEGPDNSGKSTLVTRLSKDLKAVVVNSQVVPPPHEYWVKDYVRWYEEAARFNQQIVLDRHPVISDPIYGPVIRGKTPLSEAYCRNVRSTLCVIYCRPPIGAIRNFGERAQMTGVKEKIADLVAGYDAMMSNPGQFRSVLRYDWTQNAYPFFLRAVRSILSEQQ